MKNLTLLSLILSIMMACNQQPSKYSSINSEYSTQDSITLADSLLAVLNACSKSNKMDKESFLDTKGSYQSPIKVIKASTFKEEYSNYYSIRLTLKNMTNKTVQAISFEWYGENAFGEPADMGSVSISGYGSGFTDEALRSGQFTTSVWSILSRDGKKVIGARAYEVAFSDGTKWERK